MLERKIYKISIEKSKKGVLYLVIYYDDLEIDRYRINKEKFADKILDLFTEIYINSTKCNKFWEVEK